MQIGVLEEGDLDEDSRKPLNLRNPPATANLVYFDATVTCFPWRWSWLFHFYFLCILWYEFLSNLTSCGQNELYFLFKKNHLFIYKYIIAKKYIVGSYSLMVT